MLNQKEMQLTLILLVLSWYLPNSGSFPTSLPEEESRQSRFIIDNRKNILFSNKGIPNGHSRISNDTYKKRLFAVERFQKDLTAQVSVIGNDFYQRRNDNLLPGKSEKALKVSEEEYEGGGYGFKVKGYEGSRKNTSGHGYNPPNFIRTEDNNGNVVKLDKYETPSVVSSTENGKVPVDGSGDVIKWPPKSEKAFLISVPPVPLNTPPKAKTDEHLEIPRESYVVPKPNIPFTNAHGTTTTTFPWGYITRKTEDHNTIGQPPKISTQNEREVYETRIERMSYHQEVLYDRGKTETGTEKNSWYHTEKRKEPEPTASYDDSDYEDDSVNDTHQVQLGKSYRPPQDDDYDEPEHNYDKTEKNYHQHDQHYEEPEKNYEEPERNYEEPEKNYEQSEQNYEIDEADSVRTNGRPQGPQPVKPDRKFNQNKFSYVVEGTNYRKYRIEERTPDGFIVGEYGVVSNDDGTLRGVRYTADSDTNPQLIYEALLKFLSL